MYLISSSDAQEALDSWDDMSFDCCITDPPYGMGMEHWDYSVPTVELWQEVYRTLKPGAFLLSFCSPYDETTQRRWYNTYARWYTYGRSLD